MATEHGQLASGRRHLVEGNGWLVRPRAARRRYDGHLQPGSRPQPAHDRHVPAQGREVDHRWRAPGTEAKGGKLTSSSVAGLRSAQRPLLPPAVSIGVDIGGTKVAAGAVDEHGVIVERLQESTPSHSPRAVEEAILSAVQRLRAHHRAEAVGIGAAGWVDNGQAIVAFSPHLAWRASSVLVCITLGTGIGGGLVIGGQLFRGTYGMAGEWGHMISVPDGHWCECGNRGCWEQYASGNALVREARALARTNSPVAYRLMEIVGGDPDKITGPDLTAAAIAGEPTAVELLFDVGTWLGRGIANLAAALDPEVVVIGGGVSAAGDLLLLPAQRAFRRTLTGRGFRPEARLVLAHFRNDAGLIGAADLARRSIVEPPESGRFGFWPRRNKRKVRR